MRPAANARFTVVIPALNEAAFLGRTLESIQAQDFVGSVEVIVVDNNSTDETREIAVSYGVVTLAEPHAGVCFARQRGTAAATGDIVVSTDADTVHPSDWLSRIDAEFRADASCVAVAGPCRFEGGPFWARVYPILLFGVVHLVLSLTGRLVYASATNLAFRRSSFPGYDTRLTQGGDELGVLRCLRDCGTFRFATSNSVTTSARRLRRGLLYNLVVTLVFYYLLGYLVNRLTSRTIMPMAPTFRAERPPRRSSLMLACWLPVTLGGLLIWAV